MSVRTVRWQYDINTVVSNVTAPELHLYIYNEWKFIYFTTSVHMKLQMIRYPDGFRPICV